MVGEGRPKVKKVGDKKSLGWGGSSDGERKERRGVLTGPKKIKSKGEPKAKGGLKVVRRGSRNRN